MKRPPLQVLVAGPLITLGAWTVLIAGTWLIVGEALNHPFIAAIAVGLIASMAPFVYLLLLAIGLRALHGEGWRIEGARWMSGLWSNTVLLLRLARSPRVAIRAALRVAHNTRRQPS